MKVWEYFRGHWQLAALLAIVFALWNYPVMYPLKMLVIFLHEASHAFAALLSGGEVLELSLVPREGGHVKSRGGNRFFISSAGYLGSLFLGSLMLVLALKSKLDKFIVGLLGVSMLVLTAFYIRAPFPLAFCIIGGLSALLSARFLNRQFNDLLLRLIGLTSMIYVPYDIFSDTLSRSYLRSDARNLAETYGGTTVMWGSIWLVISLVFIVFIARLCLSSPSNLFFAPPNQQARR